MKLRTIKNAVAHLAWMSVACCAFSAGVAKAATVDVLVLYDTYSKNYFGGDPQTAMTSWVNQINAAYKDSQVDLQVRLVGVRPNEDASTDMGTVLGNIRVNNSILALRDQLGADFVSQLHQSGSCGIGYVAVSKNWAFNVVGPNCGALTMAHELGHNMGLNHSRRQGNTGGERYGYGLGYGVDNQFVDIMAYASVFKASRIAKFSNPNLQCKGLPCGVPVGQPDEAYAALALQNVRDELANFRPTAGGGAVATVAQDCNYGGYNVGLGVGKYTTSQLIALGIKNDDISSLHVQSGYTVTLYTDDSFAGNSITRTADDSCFVTAGFNDVVSSVVVSAATTSSSSVSSVASSKSSSIVSSVASSKSSSSSSSVVASKSSLSSLTTSSAKSSSSSSTASAAVSILVQAENYFTSVGVQTENTTDIGGGLNVGWIDTADWMAYEAITFPVTGTYTIEYRVASANGGGRLSLDLNGGTIVLGEVAIPSTGAWQKWETITQTVTVKAGTYNLGVYAKAGGWNLNWLRIKR